MLLLTEALGGVHTTALRLLKRLHLRARTPGHRDGTVYGSATTATHSFRTHHLRLISHAAFKAIGETLLQNRDTDADEFLCHARPAPPVATLRDYMPHRPAPPRVAA